MLRLLLSVLLSSATLSADGPKPAPGQLNNADLEGFAQLSQDRQRLIGKALETGRKLPLSLYVFGSADPDRGGFDCSGAMYYLLRQVAIQPPRSSAAQFDWLKEAGRLVEVPAVVTSLDHEIFQKLRPGDLLFWGGTYQSTDGRTNGVTHVQMYLGREKKDGKPVMIGSSDGRSYRGSARCGFGVFDFKLPQAGSKSRFLGFGTPSGISEGPAATAESPDGQPAR